jgi:hypothetical protein
MNVKKRLESRIRGWLPKEPRLSSTRFTCVPVKQDFEVNLKTPIIIPAGSSSVTELFKNWLFMLTATSVVLIAVVLISRFVFSPISILQGLFWTIAGFVVGVIPSIIYANKQLCELSRNYQTFSNKRDIYLFNFPPFASAFFGFLIISIFSHSSLIGFIWFQAVQISFALGRFLLFRVFEKKAKMRIFQGQAGSLILVPKEPELKT